MLCLPSFPINTAFSCRVACLNPLSSSALDGVLLSLIVHIPTKYRRPEDGLSTKPFPLKFAKKDLLPSGVH